MIERATLQCSILNNHRDDEELKLVEEELRSLEDLERGGYGTNESTQRLFHLEAYKRIILEEEAWWSLKSSAIWLKSGDDNTISFQNFVKGRKSDKNVWALNH